MVFRNDDGERNKRAKRDFDLQARPKILFLAFFDASSSWSMNTFIYRCESIEENFEKKLTKNNFKN